MKVRIFLPLGGAQQAARGDSTPTIEAFRECDYYFKNDLESRMLLAEVEVTLPPRDAVVRFAHAGLVKARDGINAYYEKAIGELLALEGPKA